VIIEQAEPPPQTPITVLRRLRGDCRRDMAGCHLSVDCRSRFRRKQARCRGRAGASHAAGLPDAGVLLSTQHSSLRPGYWVKFSGVLSHDDAVTRMQEAQAAGFGDSYVRFVSES